MMLFNTCERSLRNIISLVSLEAYLRNNRKKQDVVNRWGSTRVSTESYLNHKDDSTKEKFANFKAINLVIKGLKLKHEETNNLLLTDDEMAVIDILHGFLRELDIYATDLGGSKYVTSSIVQPVMKSIESHISPNVNDVAYI